MIPGIENRHQSGSIRAVTPRVGRSRGRGGAPGCGLVMTGDARAGQEWVLLMWFYAGRLCPGRFNAPLRIGVALPCHVPWRIILIGWPPGK